MLWRRKWQPAPVFLNGDLVDGAGDGGEQLLPAHPDVLGRNQGESVAGPVVPQ